MAATAQHDTQAPTRRLATLRGTCMDAAARTEQEAHAGAWAGQLAAEPDPACKVGLFARWSRELFTTSHDVVVAHPGPAAAELASEGDRRRRQAVEALVAAVAAAGALRPGLTARQAADWAWILTGPEVYLLAAACGWTAEDYQEWLAALLCEQILQPASGDGQAPDNTPARREHERTRRADRP